MTAFSIAAVGFKGKVFLEYLLANNQVPACLYTYKQSSDDSDYSTLFLIAKKNNIKVHETKILPNDLAHHCFLVGWQYLAKEADKLIVFHDSLLPKYRGFAPTVTALINGDTEIGVTALLPDKGIDTGPIIGQKSVQIKPPMFIKEALAIQSKMMGHIAIDVLRKIENNNLVGVEQKEQLASYSPWRDEEDYRLDFSLPASTLVRTVLALSSPYEGACFIAENKIVRCFDAQELPEIEFTPRHPGKCWSFLSDSIDVICGSGMIRLANLFDNNGAPWTPKKLRQRLK